jgi:hypothetical protein
MERSASDYAQSGLNSPSQPLTETQSESPAVDQATAAAAAAAATAAAAAATSPSVPPAPATPGHQPSQYATSQPEIRPGAQYAAPVDSRSANISTSNTPQPDYSLSQSATQPPPPSARPPYPEYLARQPQYHHAPNTQAGGAVGMAQATSPSMTLPDGQQNNHRNGTQIKSDSDVPIDPSIAASSPTYPPPYSPYNPQGHDMAQYQGHPQHPQMYGRPEWHGYPGIPGPYTAPPSTTVSSAAPTATAGPPRPGQVSFLFLFLPFRLCLAPSASLLLL